LKLPDNLASCPSCKIDSPFATKNDGHAAAGKVQAQCNKEQATSAHAEQYKPREEDDQPDETQEGSTPGAASSSSNVREVTFAADPKPVQLPLKVEESRAKTNALTLK